MGVHRTLPEVHLLNRGTDDTEIVVCRQVSRLTNYCSFESFRARRRGDLVVGDREGVYFIPPQLVREVLDRADEIRIHDEWTKKKFDEGKYKSSEIYPTPSDPKLLQEYQEYLKRRLEEIRRQRSAK